MSQGKVKLCTMFPSLVYGLLSLNNIFLIYCYLFLRSGGMSNELNNILSIHTDGVYEGVAIGGDRYPGSTFVDHLLRYQVGR